MALLLGALINLHSGSVGSVCKDNVLPVCLPPLSSCLFLFPSFHSSVFIIAISPANFPQQLLSPVHLIASVDSLRLFYSSLVSFSPARTEAETSSHVSSHLLILTPRLLSSLTYFCFPLLSGLFCSCMPLFSSPLPHHLLSIALCQLFSHLLFYLFFLS